MLDKSKYEAQLTDIIKISVSNIYQSQEVIEKEIAGYEILATLLDARCRAIKLAPMHYDRLIKNLIEELPIVEYGSTYQELMAICNYVSVMTYIKSLRIFQKIKIFNII